MTNIVAIKGSYKASNMMSEGMRRSGDTFYSADNLSDPVIESADAFVQTNMLKPKFTIKNKLSPYEYILKSGKPFLVNESPSFRRVEKKLVYKRYGWYSYKWTDGIFGHLNSPSDRWQKFQKATGINIKDWNSPGDSIIFMGQKEGDSSLLDLYKDYDSFYDWAGEKISEIRRYSDRPIVLRPHPRNFNHGRKLAKKLKVEYKNVSISEDPIIENDFAKAYCIVTYNSLSAVEAVCDGIPTFTLDNGSMAWPIGHKDLSQIEKLNYDIDRTQWCYDIAYTQWNNKECKTGEAWAHLKPLIFK